MPDDARKLLWKADELQAQERATTQRLNPNSHLLRIGLSPPDCSARMSRWGTSRRARIPSPTTPT